MYGERVNSRIQISCSAGGDSLMCGGMYGTCKPLSHTYTISGHVPLHDSRRRIVALACREASRNRQNVSSIGHNPLLEMKSTTDSRLRFGQAERMSSKRLSSEKRLENPDASTTRTSGRTRPLYLSSWK